MFPRDPHCSKKFFSVYLCTYIFKALPEYIIALHFHLIQFRLHIPISFQLPVSDLGSYFITFIIVLVVLLLSLFSRGCCCCFDEVCNTFILFLSSNMLLVIAVITLQSSFITNMLSTYSYFAVS